VSGRPAVPVAARLPLLAGGGLGLLGRLYTALLLLDVPLPDTAAGVGPTHGPVMVFGFVGTLVALERAVALGARWALLAPACSGLGAVTLLAGGQARAGWLLLSVAAVGLLGAYAALWRRQASVAPPRSPGRSAGGNPGPLRAPALHRPAAQVRLTSDVIMVNSAKVEGLRLAQRTATFRQKRSR
jgi:hypothetical protein